MEIQQKIHKMAQEKEEKIKKAQDLLQENSKYITNYKSKKYIQIKPKNN